MQRKTTIKVVLSLALSWLLPMSMQAQPPQVESVSPAPNAVNVGRTTNVTVQFDVAMDPGTINDNSFVINGSRGGRYFGNITYDGTGFTAVLDPTDQFHDGEVVTATLTTGIQSSTGQPPAAPLVWSFTVEVDDDPGGFAPQSSYHTGAEPYGVEAADLDGDGDLDIVTANEKDDNVALLFNDGLGHFDPPVTYAAGAGPWDIGIADFDADGDVDLAVAAKLSDEVHVLLNEEGVFTHDSAYVGGNGNQAIEALDLSGDGVIDLATANVYDGSISVMLGLGDGRFGPQTQYACSGNPFDLSAADFDNDGDLDIATVNTTAHRVAVMFNDGSGAFAVNALYPAGSGPWSLYAGDLNGDYAVDLAATNYFSNNVSVLINEGTGGFLTAVNYSTRLRPFAVLAADFDADADLDIVIANYNSDTLSYLANNGDGGFADQQLLAAGDAPTALVAADVDGDSDLDVVAANQKASTVSILKNQLSLLPHPFAFEFAAYGDGPNPDVQELTITSNGYELDYSVTSNASWLSVADPAGQTPTTTAVQVYISGLLVGEYQGSLTLESSDPLTMPFDLPITLNVTNWPKLPAIVEHNRGEMVLSVTNQGVFGTGYIPGPKIDYFTGEPVASCEYPKGSEVNHLYGATIWIGAVVGQDTLVSVGHDGWSAAGEMFDVGPGAPHIVHRSTLDPNSPEYIDAVSEQDYVTTYVDTVLDGVDEDWSGRPHVPLGLEITQSSFAWSLPYAEDFVMIDYRLQNIGAQLLDDVYVGFLVDADICYDCTGISQGFTDDISGFRDTASLWMGGCMVTDSVMLAWTADNDGDLNAPFPSAPDVAATRVLRAPSDSLQYAFNWWIGNGNAELDFGPRLRPTAEDPWRDFGTGGLGTPEGDANKYYIMSHSEIDYDQIYTASIPPDDPLWMEPNQELAYDFSDGYDTRYLLSFGPFQVAPGAALPLTIAQIAGADLHRDPYNLNYLPDQPGAFMAGLEFTDLILNSMWASWIYDNPGYDTDDDGYAGEWMLCNDDTIWYRGDGVPDFRGATAPPPPVFWPASRPGGLAVRINGLVPMTTRDLFSRRVDFEGFRVYLASDDNPESLTEIATFDREDYHKYTWNAGASQWQLRDYPYSMDSLRCLYGDSCADLTFDPLIYTPDTPYVHPNFPESLFYFEAAFGNAYECGVSTDICRIYPDQPYPTNLDPAQAQPDELTPDGHLKYFEYSLEVPSLLPEHCYFVSVTAFDYGTIEAGVGSLESNRYDGVQSACSGLPEFICGDIDSSAVEPVDIADLTYLIDYMFLAGPPPSILYTADVNCDGLIDIADLVAFIDFMFRDGPPLQCCTEGPNCCE